MSRIHAFVGVSTLLCASALAQPAPRPWLAGSINLNNSAELQPYITRLYKVDTSNAYWAAGPVGLAMGDFDGDGLDDLAIGAPFDSTSGIGGAGEATIQWGDPMKRGAFLYGFYSRGLGGGHAWNEARIVGEGLNHAVGRRVAAGDFDGDGFDDLVVAVPGFDLPGRIDSGAVAIHYGGADLRGLTLSALSIGTVDPRGPTILLGDDSFELADAIAVGDFDGDGYDDLALGSPGADTPGGNNTGWVSIIAGGPDLRGVFHTLSTNTKIDGNPLPRTVYVQGAAPGYRAGAALAAGDFDGDGWTDLAITSPGYDTADVGGASDAGAVQILPGSDAFFVGLGGATILPNYVNESKGGAANVATYTASEPDGFAGEALAAGDWNADGYDDLAMGAPRSHSQAGTVHVIEGNPLLLSHRVVDLDDPTSAPELRYLRIGSTIDGERAGAMLSMGDMDGDGRDELGIAGPGAPRSGLDEVGRVHVLYPVPSDGPTTLTLSTAARLTDISGANEFDEFGQGLVMGGDFDGDGIGDLAATERSEDVPDDYGPMAIIYGAAAGDTATRTRRLNSSAAKLFADFGPAVRLRLDARSSASRGVMGLGNPAITTTLGRSAGTGVSIPSGEALPPRWSVQVEGTLPDTLTLRFKLTPQDVLGFARNSLSVYVSDAPNGAYAIIPNSRLTTNGFTVEARLPSFEGTRHFLIGGERTGVRIDGLLDAAYGPPISVQTVSTHFGDADTGELMASGSELDAMYVTNDDDNVYVFLAGNLESNGNIIGLMIDNVADTRGLNGTIPDIYCAWDPWFLSGRLDGGTLPVGFNPDYFIGFKHFDIGGNGIADWTYHEADLRDLLEFLSPDASSVAESNPLEVSYSDLAIGFNNANVGGVADGTVYGFDFAGTDPALVPTGLEFAIPRSRIGRLEPGGEMRLVAVVGNYVLDYMSNQYLPPLPTPRANVAFWPGNFDLVGLGIQPASAFVVGPTSDTAGLNVVMTSIVPSPGHQRRVPVLATFRRDVTGFDANDITTDAGVIENFAMIDASHYSFDLVVPADQETTVHLQIAAGAATDGIADSLPSTPFQRKVDLVEPQVVSFGPHAVQAVPATAGPIRFTVMFSEPVVGFGVPALSTASSTAGGGKTLSASGSGAGPYTVFVNGLTHSGLVTVEIGPSLVQDAAGNTIGGGPLSATIPYRSSKSGQGVMVR